MELYRKTFDKANTPSSRYPGKATALGLIDRCVGCSFTYFHTPQVHRILRLFRYDWSFKVCTQTHIHTPKRINHSRQHHYPRWRKPSLRPALRPPAECVQLFSNHRIQAAATHKYQVLCKNYTKPSPAIPNASGHLCSSHIPHTCMAFHAHGTWEESKVIIPFPDIILVRWNGAFTIPAHWCNVMRLLGIISV